MRKAIQKIKEKMIIVITLVGVIMGVEFWVANKA